MAVISPGRRALPTPAWMLMLGFIFSLLAAAGCDRPPPPAAPGPLPPHHTPTGFKNLHLQDRGRFREFLRWRLGLGPEEKPALPPEAVPPYRPQVVAPDRERLQHPDPGVLQVTWIGHATFLLQVAGVNILTDPMFSDRASPVSFIGPKRLTPPGVPFRDLPPIHAVVISHNHYDHLDAPTVTRLGNGVRFFVPLGLGRWFKQQGLDKVVELDWWHSAGLGPLRFTAVPAQHFSSRSLWDRNQSLWACWVVETPAGPLFFSGDTGYSVDFREIGARYGPMRLSLLAVGGYMPRWFMAPMHLNPPEAVQIHQDLRSRQSLGMHWGTFPLTDEPLGEPPLYLQKALKDAGIPEPDFTVLKFGETRVFR
jgi:N-acyl-phosphatidylethanolamine-hydrolysing phospholipase D